MENKVGVYFSELLRHNEAAMMHLSNTRLTYLAYQSEPWKVKSGKITKEYDQSFEAVKKMAKNYLDLVELLWGAGKRKRTEEQNLKDALDNAEKGGINSVLTLEAIVDGIIPSTKDTEALQNLYRDVERLTPPMENQEQIEINKVQTLHDCIRYLHQRALNLVFTAQKSPEVHAVYQTLIKRPAGELFANIKVVDLTPQGIKNLSEYCLFYHQQGNRSDELIDARNIPSSLCAFFQVYHDLKDKIENLGSQAVEILSFDNHVVLAQVWLGCHYAKIESKVDDRDHFISLNYHDITSAYSENRLRYINVCLQKLGYQTEIRGRDLTASIRNKSRQHTFGALKETIRLLISSKDLDMSPSIYNREYEAVYQFLRGATDIVSLLKKNRTMNQKKCKVFVSNYTYHFNPYEEKEDL